MSEEIASTGLSDLLTQEIEIAEGVPRACTGYLAEVQRVRKAAFDNFPVDEGAARHALFLFAAHIHFSWLAVRFAEDFPERAYSRLLLGAFASLEVLNRRQAELTQGLPG